MAGENNNLAVRTYTKEFKEMLQAVFEKAAMFGDFFVGGVEALDGIQHNAKAFSVKTSDIPVTVGDGYNTDADVAFGDGTANSSRFGEMTEIIYTDTDVEYAWGWNWHEGIDRYTVNNDFDTAIADRLQLQAEAKTELFNAKHSAFISATAQKTITVKEVTEEAVIAAFNELHKYYVNIKAKGTPVAKVTADIINALVDANLTTTAKGSSVNIDRETVTMFKGIAIDEIAEDYFQDDEIAYIYIPGIAKAFTGIETSRTIEADDFDGVKFQGAGKAGEYILPANKAAVAKVVVSQG